MLYDICGMFPAETSIFAAEKLKNVLTNVAEHAILTVVATSVITLNKIL